MGRQAADPENGRNDLQAADVGRNERRTEVGCLRGVVDGIEDDRRAHSAGHDTGGRAPLIGRPSSGEVADTECDFWSAGMYNSGHRQLEVEYLRCGGAWHHAQRAEMQSAALEFPSALVVKVRLCSVI